MKKTVKRIKGKNGRNTGKILLFLFVLLLFSILDPGRETKTEAGVSATEEIRVGLKSSFSGKKSIKICNTQTELGYCDGRAFYCETVLQSENGITVTPEKGEYLSLEGLYTLKQAEELAERLKNAGARAYAVMIWTGEALVYFPVAENGGSGTAAKANCKEAAQKCGVVLSEVLQESEYLIRIDAGTRVLFADGAGGNYPQFAAKEKNEDGIYAVNVEEKNYRGRIEIGRYGGRGTLTAVNVVPLEEYLYGVVPCEMPASWHMEALKAQAVCARSYALIKAGYHAETDIRRGFRMADTVQSQVYGGTVYEHPRSTAAVDATKGETLCYENRTVTGYYFAASGGHTESVEDVWDFSVPYLQGVPDIYETNPSKKPWSVTLSDDELLRLLQKEGKDTGAIKRITGEVVTSSGRVSGLRVTGSLGSIRLATDALRNVLELASTKFRVFDAHSVPDAVTVLGTGGTKETTIHECYIIGEEGEVRKADGLTEQYVVLGSDNMTSYPRYAPEEGEYLFAGMGHGHGVGMSQSGAYGMATEGFTYTEILEHYFTGISVR